MSFGIFSENCDCLSNCFFFTKKIENLIFGLNCSSFSLQLNNEIHVFLLFLYGVLPSAALSKFRAV